jgi:hypothetical protein
MPPKNSFKQFCTRGHDRLIVGIQAHKRGCKGCCRLTGKAWQWRQRGIKNLDGSQFTLVDYDRLYQCQQGRCKICGKHQTELDQTLNADHNHKTGIIRGLLCRDCNTNLISALESPLIVRAKEYLGEK